MIELHGQIKPLRLHGHLNVVPVEGSTGGPLQAKTAYPSHSEQIIAPDGDYYGLVSVTVKPVPRLPACVVSVAEGIHETVENVVDIGAEISVTSEKLAYDPLINISMDDGSNLGTGGSDYAATNSGGSFTDGKFVIDGAGYLTVPTSFMAGTDPWTVAFTIDAYAVGTSAYGRIARGNNDVPSIFYTKSVAKFQPKLAYRSANTKYATVVNSSYVEVNSQGACLFAFSATSPTTFVFRNNGEYISLWMNGMEILRETSSRYSSDKYASTFSIGDNDSVGSDMAHMECSMLKIWDRALSDIEIPVVN